MSNRCDSRATDCLFLNVRYDKHGGDGSDVRDYEKDSGNEVNLRIGFQSLC